MRMRNQIALLALFTFLLGLQAVKAETIEGVKQGAGQAGLVSITIQGDPLIHSGILAGPNLVITGKRWFSANTNPNTVTVAHGHANNRTPETRTATHVWLHPSLPIALVRVHPTFSSIPAIAFDGSNPGPAANSDLVCFGFSAGGDLKRAELRVQGSAQNGYVIVSRARTDMILNDGSGMPCFTTGTGGVATNVLAGIAVGTTGAAAADAKNIQVGAFFFRDWIPNMKYLASTVLASRPRPLSLYVKPDPANPNRRLCLDIPFGSVAPNAAVNQYDCHGGANQLFFLHQFNDPRNTAISHQTIVQYNSGLCLDIPNGSRTAGVKVQQYPCHRMTNSAGGWLNQDWQYTVYPPQPPGGLKFNQVFSNLCLSGPSGGAVAQNSVGVEQNTCQNGATNLNQRWFIQWK